MALETITGQAVLNGVQNNGTPITITGYATFILDRMDGEHQWDGYQVKDSLGFDASDVAFNEHFEITIDFTPSGATRAAAAAVPSVPIPLSTVTLANCKVATTFGSSSGQLFNGNYVYKGGTKINFQSAAAGKMTGIRLRKYADPTQNTNMTTFVVG